jgi:4-amino-4-deoxy-L-arabinose transferase-like glycosyltransferase
MGRDNYMSSLVQEKSRPRNKEILALQIPRERMWEFAGIAFIILLGAWLRFANLDSLGYVNHYYTAGVKSMLQSWHNFFYVAAEPGGSVSIDKPPVGLWLQAISAYFLGVNGFAVLLPQLLAGTISVAVLYHLVRRSFGVVPGLLAALVMAITPVVVATDRNNTMDSTLILTLLLATWAFIKATETSRLRYLLIGVALVGLGFNIKMLQAYLPLPAFYALYFLGSKESIWRKSGKLILASALLLIISLSWALAVDLTPASQRPYVGSSSENSETDLILGYNGVNRLLGMFGRRGNESTGPGPGGFAPPQNPGQAPDGSDGNPMPPGGFSQPTGNEPPSIDGSADRMNRGPGGFNIGTPGVLRLFIPPLSKETSWLLPFGIVSMVLLAAGSRWHRTLSSKHQALSLWGGWLVTCAIFFSIAGFFHEYYLSMMGPPLAALVAIGAGELWSLAREKQALALGLLALSAMGIIAFQIYTANNFVQNIWWLPAVIVLVLAGLSASSFSLRDQNRRALGAGFACIFGAMLLTPGIWSVYTNLSSSQNQSLPAAYSGGANGPVAQRDLWINQDLLDYLQGHTQNMTYLMAVPSAMQGADYVLATGRPVLYVGGFNGQDQVVTADDLADMVQAGELRYLYWNAEDRGMGTNSDISTWIQSACQPVEGFDTATRNAGAPDGTIPDQNSSLSPNGGSPGADLQVSLYDCANTK